MHATHGNKCIARFIQQFDTTGMRLKSPHQGLVAIGVRTQHRKRIAMPTHGEIG